MDSSKDKVNGDSINHIWKERRLSNLNCVTIKFATGQLAKIFRKSKAKSDAHLEHTAQKMKFPADFVTFTEEMLNGKLNFMCSDIVKHL